MAILPLALIFWVPETESICVSMASETERICVFMIPETESISLDIESVPMTCETESIPLDSESMPESMTLETESMFASLAAETAHQVFAAIGFTHDHMLNFLTRRLWCWRAAPSSGQNPFFVSTR